MGGKPPIVGTGVRTGQRGRPGLVRGTARGPRVPVNVPLVRDGTGITPPAGTPGLLRRIGGAVAGFFRTNGGAARAAQGSARPALTGPVARTVEGVEHLFLDSGPTMALPPVGVGEEPTDRLAALPGVSRPEVGVRLPSEAGQAVTIDLSRTSSTVQLVIQRSAREVPTFQPRGLISIISLPDKRLSRETPHVTIQYDPTTRVLTLTEKASKQGTYLRRLDVVAGTVEPRVGLEGAVDGKVTYRLPPETAGVTLAFDKARDVVFAQLHVGATAVEATANPAVPARAKIAAPARPATALALDEQLRAALNSGKGPYTIKVDRTSGAAVVTLTHQTKVRGQINVAFPAEAIDAEIVETMQAIVARAPLFEAVDPSRRVQNPTVTLTIRYVAANDAVLETPRFARHRGHLGIDGIVELRSAKDATRSAADLKNGVLGEFRPEDFAGSTVPPAFIYMTWQSNAVRRANLIGNAWGKVRTRIPTISEIGADTGGHPRKR